ncbi:MAG: hypothetical protein M1820_006619 [Bogoriella megaspora]|nr:MAG: hypothetical protein M1820_006619 [Bogoriella megaspora]
MAGSVLDGDYWETKEERKLAQKMWTGYLTPRRKAVREAEDKILVLEMHCVDPAFRRQGIGHILVRNGLEMADKMGLKTFVEATPEGRALYEQEGFEVEIEQYTVQLGEEFSGRPTQSFTWMVHTAKK